MTQTTNPTTAKIEYKERKDNVQRMLTQLSELVANHSRSFRDALLSDEVANHSRSFRDTLLSDEVANHSRSFRDTQHRDWCFVNEIRYVEEQLQEAINFLTNPE